MLRMQLATYILAASLITISTKSLTTAQDAETSEISKAIETCRSKINAVLEESNIPGLGVAVAHDGELLWSEGFGLVDLELQAEVTTQTRFGLGSITKSLTTALCARLVDLGKLDFDASVESYLPKYPHAGKGISVRLLAGHLSGMGDEFAVARYYSNEHFATTWDALVPIWNEPLRSEPGSEHFYTNGAFTVIAGIVERVTGQSFQDAMKTHVLDPLSMHDTVPNDPNIIIANRTSFYLTREDSTIYEAATFDPSHKLAAAGYLSTAEDLVKLGCALLGDDFLSAEVKGDLFESLRTTGGDDTGFGLGWRITADDDGKVVYHQPGGGPGISCWILLEPSTGLVSVSLANLRFAPVLDPLNTISENFGAAIASEKATP